VAELTPKQKAWLEYKQASKDARRNLSKLRSEPKTNLQQYTEAEKQAKTKVGSTWQAFRKERAERFYSPEDQDAIEDTVFPEADEKDIEDISLLGDDA
jgi:hypothetical protein